MAAARVWQHDQLLDDLAGYLRSPDRMVWCDMQLGPSGSKRPDVFTMQKSYSRPAPAAFEVKISRSDLRSDTTSGKWQGYLQFAGSVTFATPDGLCTSADIPEGCGLIVRKEAVWRYVRKPTLRAIENMPRDAWMKLLIDGVARCSRSAEPRPRQIAPWKEHEAVRKKFGQAVAEAARDLASVHERISQQRALADHLYEETTRKAEGQRVSLLEQAKRDAGQYEEAKRDLIALLGLESDASIYAVRRALAAAKISCDADTRVQAAEAKVGRVRQAVDQALRIVSE